MIDKTESNNLHQWLQALLRYAHRLFDGEARQASCNQFARIYNVDT